MKIKGIINCIEDFAPDKIQESYDNSGLILGNYNSDVNKALICIDVTEDIIEEAINKKCDIIISHHPLIFNSLKKINGKNAVEKILIKAIKNDISIYAAHTNLDNVIDGVSGTLSKKLFLKDTKTLLPKADLLRKLVTFCPKDKADEVRSSLFKAGAGHIGNYDCCSFNTNGIGSFRALENANPYAGNIGELHNEDEVKIETIYPYYLEDKILRTLFKVHPYEEVAYDIYPLINKFDKIGAGIVGYLEKEENEMDFLLRLKKVINAKCIRYTKLPGKKVKKIAICGGTGSFLIQKAIEVNADIFITADIKYHQFFDANNKIIIADIGHYESEQFVKELLYSIINKKFPNFAIFISEINTNPVNYI